MYETSLIRNENGGKRSVKGSTIFTLTFFHRKRKRYDIIENENDIGNAVILETKIYGRGHIENDRNPLKRYFEKMINMSNHRAQH